MLNKEQKEYVRKLLEKYKGPKHDTDFFKDIGLEKFAVFEGVLDPEKSILTSLFAKFFIEHKELYKDADVLEIGTGSGIAAIVIAMNGAKKVVATDIQDICISNAEENIKRFGLKSVLNVRKGDLFEPIKENEKFDLIAFNHPFFFDKPDRRDSIQVSILDEGNIIKMFLSEAGKHLKPNGRIIMPFTDAAGEGNDPKTHAEEYGFNIRVIFSIDTEHGRKIIYEIIPKS